MALITQKVLDAWQQSLEETPAQQTLKLLQGSGSERKETSRKQYPRKAKAKPPVNGKHAKRVIYGETEIPDEDISDVGT